LNKKVPFKGIFYPQRGEKRTQKKKGTANQMDLTNQKKDSQDS